MQVQQTLKSAIQNFIKSRRSDGLVNRTIEFYSEKLLTFEDFCKGASVGQVEALTPDILRSFMLTLNGHTPGGQHAYYRALRAMLLWYEDEYEPDAWRNPIRKVKAPKVPEELLEPVQDETVELLLRSCRGDDLYNVRDKAVILFLFKTGVRASELIHLDLSDVNLITGEALIRQGKGRKPRMVFMNRQTKRAVRAYVKRRGSDPGALFLTRYQERFKYEGLRHAIQERARAMGIEPPPLHSFRRAFALNCLREGMDVFTLQRLMGHADLSTLKVYLNQTTDDLRRAVERLSDD